MIPGGAEDLPIPTRVAEDEGPGPLLRRASGADADVLALHAPQGELVEEVRLAVAVARARRWTGPLAQLLLTAKKVSSDCDARGRDLCTSAPCLTLMISLVLAPYGLPNRNLSMGQWPVYLHT